MFKMALIVGLLAVLAAAAEPPASSDAAEASPASTPTQAISRSEIEQLKQMLSDQQRQIDELRRELANQRNGGSASLASTQALSAPLVAVASLGEVASTSSTRPF